MKKYQLKYKEFEKSEWVVEKESDDFIDIMMQLTFTRPTNALRMSVWMDGKVLE